MARSFNRRMGVRPLERAELDELRDIQAVRTPDRLAQAQWDDAHEDATAFASVICPAFDLKAPPKTAALLAEVQTAQEGLASQASFEAVRRELAAAGLNTR